MESDYFNGIPFNEEWDVAISLSGGADSALLAYMVCNMATEKQTVHIIHHVRVWKIRPWQEEIATNVYEYLKEKFPKLTFVFHKNFVAPELEYKNIGPTLTDEYGKKVSGDNIQQRAYGEYICHKYNIDAYYNAVTRNPRLTDLDGMHERDLEPTDKNKHMEYMIHMGRVVSHPFRFVDKSWVLKKYKELDIMDLFDMTRSCVSPVKDIDYTNYTVGQYVPVCNECFWCKERSWAIEQSK